MTIKEQKTIKRYLININTKEKGCMVIDAENFYQAEEKVPKGYTWTKIKYVETFKTLEEK